MVLTIIRENFERVHTHSDAWSRMRRDAPRLEETPGLIRTYCLLGDNGIATGSVQVWRSRQHAEAFFGKPRGARGRQGRPAIEYFRVPLVTGEGFDIPEAIAAE